MANEEVNPAEAAAEEILKRAADDIRAESCPQGKDCAVHFRVNEEFVKDEYEYARLITYMGEYVVITDDNPEAVSVVALIQAALNGKPLTPDRWETSIYHIGEGTISDLSDKTVEERRQSLRYHSTHDDWSLVPEAHHSVVSALEAGLIDVSKPVDL